MASAAGEKPTISLPLQDKARAVPAHGLRLIRIGGLIGYFELSNWWFTRFNKAEREHIQARFRIPGYDTPALVNGKISSAPYSDVSFLIRMARLFPKPYHRHIAHRFLDEAETRFSETTRFIEAHYCYDQRIRLSAADHGFDPMAPRRTRLSCEMQIFIAPDTASELVRKNSRLPCHRGYYQLINASEKELEYSRTLSLSLQALKQGWAGDWTARIERCQRRLTENKSRWI